MRWMLLVGLLLVGACTSSPREQPDAGRPDSSRAEPAPGAAFVNPTFACPSAQVVEPEAGYPHPERGYPLDRDDPSRSVEALTQFCETTLAAFAEPNLTRAEAEAVYRALEPVLSLSDESYGMPSPDAPAQRAVDLRERVMLRQTGPYTFELFFYRIGCGRTYEVLRAKRDAQGTMHLAPVEKWRETFPC